MMYTHLQACCVACFACSVCCTALHPDAVKWLMFSGLPFAYTGYGFAAAVCVRRRSRYTHALHATQEQVYTGVWMRLRVRALAGAGVGGTLIVYIYTGFASLYIFITVFR